MAALVDFYNVTLRPNLNINAILPELSPQEKSDRHILNCPSCKAREAYIYKSGFKCNTIFCNRGTQCGYEEYLLTYLNNGVKPQDKEFVNLLRKLSDISGVTFPEREYSPQEIKQYEEREEKQRLLSDFCNVCTEALKDEPLGKNARDYWEKVRGRDLSLIDKYNLGFYPNSNYIKEKLKKFNHLPGDIDASGIMRPDWDNRLVFPKTRGSNIIDFVARDISGKVPKNEKSLRMNKEKRPGVGLFGFDKAERNKIAVEGHFDKFALDASGIKGVVALEGSILEDAHIDQLREDKTENFDLFLDNDATGIERRLTAIKKTKNENFCVGLIPADGLKGEKDPDDFVKKYGTESLHTLLKTKVHAFRYMAHVITERHKTGNVLNDFERIKACEEAVAFAKDITNPKQQIAVADIFWPEFREQTGMTNEAIEVTKKHIKDKQEHLRQKESAEKYVTQYKELIDDGKFEEASILKNPLLTETSTSLIIQPYTFENFLSDIATTQSGLKTGFKELDAVALVPSEALTFILARPSHGKTTFMLNMFLNMVKEYPDKQFDFFSYEETNKQVALKMIMILSGYVFPNKYQNSLMYESFIRNGYNSNPAIDAGMKLFAELMKSGRIKIFGKNYTIQELQAIIEQETSNNNVGAAYLDYIQKVPNKEKFGTRQLELQDTSARLLNIAKSNKISIISGAQAVRNNNTKGKVPEMNDARECGDLEQDANCMFGLYNDSMENKTDETTIDLIVNPIKNRNGRANVDITLTFEKPSLTITDKVQQKQSRTKDIPVVLAEQTTIHDDEAHPSHEKNKQQRIISFSS